MLVTAQTSRFTTHGTNLPDWKAIYLFGKISGLLKPSDRRMRKLYHGTSIKRCMKILADGHIHKESCWGTLPMAKYFGAESALEDNCDPAFLCIEIDDNLHLNLQADYHMVDYPICHIIGDYDRGELYEIWMNSERQWKNSLEIYHSVVLIEPMPISIMHVYALSISEIENKIRQLKV